MVYPKCTVSCCAAGNTSPPRSHQHPSSSCVVHHPTHSLSISPSLSFTPWLHIDLNSFVSYWSATPPSAALNKHKDTNHAHTSLIHALVQMQHMHALYKTDICTHMHRKKAKKTPFYSTALKANVHRLTVQADKPAIAQSSFERFQKPKARRFREVSAQASDKLMTYKGTWIPYWSNTSGARWKHRQSRAGTGRRHNYSCSSCLRFAELKSESLVQQMKIILFAASCSETYTSHMSFVAVVVYIHNLKTIYSLQDKNY